MTHILETERLIIRYFREDDMKSFLSYRKDIDISKYQSWNNDFTEEMAVNFIDSQKELKLGYSENKWIQIAFEEKLTSMHIGDCALKISNKIAEIGFTITKEKQWKGFASEGVSAVIELLFNKLDLHRIYAITDIDNIASINLLTKLRFRKEGCSIESYFDTKMNKWRDELHFALLKKEW